ncbi:MAG: hypothetical protein QNJ41_26550 [Xenococcaceae cyanobacterium MO_188.B32]|nr:hypothetical protein [Xenococcaceae cyanobacterium MO_188.B32]
MIATNSIKDQSTTNKPKLELNASRQFTAWLFEQHISLTFSTYQGGENLFNWFATKR